MLAAHAGLQLQVPAQEVTRALLALVQHVLAQRGRGLAEDDVGGLLGKASPALSKDVLYEREQRPSNLLRWDLELEPGMSGERALAINYDFRLELDKMKVIQNVLSR